MSKYLVYVHELTYASVEVETNSDAEAKAKALEMATTQPLEWESDDGCYIGNVYKI